MLDILIKQKTAKGMFVYGRLGDLKSDGGLLPVRLNSHITFTIIHRFAWLGRALLCRHEQLWAPWYTGPVPTQLDIWCVLSFTHPFAGPRSAIALRYSTSTSTEPVTLHQQCDACQKMCMKTEESVRKDDVDYDQPSEHAQWTFT